MERFRTIHDAYTNERTRVCDDIKAFQKATLRANLNVDVSNTLENVLSTKYAEDVGPPTTFSVRLCNHLPNPRHCPTSAAAREVAEEFVRDKLSIWPKNTIHVIDEGASCFRLEFHFKPVKSSSINYY